MLRKKDQHVVSDRRVGLIKFLWASKKEGRRGWWRKDLKSLAKKRRGIYRREPTMRGTLQGKINIDSMFGIQITVKRILAPIEKLKTKSM